MKPRPSGFTLIELLVVIAIIAIIASLLLVLAGPLRDRLRRMDTARRADQAITGIQQYATPDLPQRVLQVSGYDLKFDSLRTILSKLISEHGLVLSAPGFKAMESLPPNLGNRWEIIRECGGNTADILDQSVDAVITFRDRQRVRARRKGNEYLYPGDIPTNIDFYYDIIRDQANILEFQKYYPGRTVNWQLVIGGSGFYPFYPRRANESPIGEHLDRTLEVRPPGIMPKQWYVSRWPNLVETAAHDASGIHFTQTCWPASDWDQSDPGVIPPIWPWPWGKKIISRLQGTQVEQMDSHTLAELSPVASLRLLQLAGIVPPGDEGAASFRSDRSPSRSWNDRWGNPLVMTFSAFVAPRYDFDSNDKINDAMFGVEVEKSSRDMFGGRDFLLLRSKETYGYFRSVYLATAAVGPRLRDKLPKAWQEDQDASTFRKLWLQCREVCRAADWDEMAWSRQPWTQCRDRKVGQERCFLTVPIEVR